MYNVTGAGEHVLTWTFTRDDFDEEFTDWENAAWLDEFTWTPAPVALTFNGSGNIKGAVPASVTMLAGCEFVIPGAGDLEKLPYEFGGWSDGSRTYAPGETFVFGSSPVTLRVVWNEKVWSLEECANVTNFTFTTSGGADLHSDFSVTRDGKVSLQGGSITHSQSTWLQGEVTGAGTLTFWWKASGQMNGSRYYDYAKFELDGEIVERNGSLGWTQVTVDVVGSGTHIFRWTYLKNASVDMGDDCAWLGEVTWTPSADGDDFGAEEFAWLKKYGLASGDVPDAATCEAAMSTLAANGKNTVEECYVAGLDPTDETAGFRAVISVVDGETQIS